ncbi:RAMP superfamily CRISPR-associated protein [Candidatus Symbiobacter mobilis]|uniref:CRISPR type III-associated protein domain-containing protein n=1 Tax=Candidatus Symbiobacter mobilis CR TaxID=946483 RepID=U5N9S2_9BURK|nr:RAMP superfamily CRISPR-associated protein [Candidatus Symbiobacter mobilis]AGX86919.1 hypothetical protein Cenrod_0813 [Candidatus Symbiobacter mobilis CR]
MTMCTVDLGVSFTTPAFLGNSKQEAQWRTPPFKALLRQWWRIVHAPKVGYDVDRLREDENRLFGYAGDESGGKSLVRMRLSGWEEGKQRALPKMTPVQHPEVKDRNTKQAIPIPPSVYLGFGPVTTQGNRPAIAPNPNNPLSWQLRFPVKYKEELMQALQLIAWFGTLGSRSRNGWGSLSVTGDGIKPYTDLSDSALQQIAKTCTLDEALQRDWPHALTQTANGRIAAWRLGQITKADNKIAVGGFASWEELLTEWAKVKIELRTSLAFPQGEMPPHPQLRDRHVLAYPVTNHGVRGIGNDKRLASSLRCKVHCHQGRYFAVLVHMPCGISTDFTQSPPNIAMQKQVWENVYAHLDQKHPTRLTRIKKGA